MTSKDFDSFVEAQIDKIRKTLTKKEREYNLEADRLGFFKRAAALYGVTPIQALYGFALKHFVSVNDMAATGERHKLSAWEEKATDIINYMILLLALAKEEEEAGEND